MTKGQKGGGACSKSKTIKANELGSVSAPVTSTDRHTSTKTRLVPFTRGNETPMHLPRLWTNAPVAKQRTQVNSTTIRMGQTGKEEPLIGPYRSKKGPTENKQARRQRGEPVGATQGGRGKEEMGYV